MPPTTNYSQYLGDLEPLAAMRKNVERIRSVTGGWTKDRFDRAYAPGKWTARQILLHLAQTEMALGTRARMALATPNYAAQRFDQDAWVNRESRLTGAEALEAFAAISRMNGALFEGLSQPDRDVASRVRLHHRRLDHSFAARPPDPSFRAAPDNRRGEIRVITTRRELKLKAEI